jgi:predicted nucleic acid-binding protein
VTVLVDTSVWSVAFRRSQNDLSSDQLRLRNLLQELITEGRAQLLGIVRQELLSGIRHNQQFEKLRVALRAFDDVKITAEDHEEAASIANRCRSAGITGNPIDFLICAVAMRRKWSILTVDEDFQHYSKYVPLMLLNRETY